MTGELIHLFIRDTDGGLYATSPQAPGLMYGRRTLTQLRADLAEVLAFHTARPGPFQVLEHHERHYDIADGELVVRLAGDDRAAERRKVYERLGRAIQDPVQARALAHGLTNPVGEAVYVCALPSDTVGWLTAQLDEGGDAFYAAVAIADQMLLTLPFACGEPYSGMEGTLTVLGRHDPGTPLSRIVHATPVVTPVPRVARATA